MGGPFKFTPCEGEGGTTSEWRERDGYRACTYCGSMHPEDLFKAIDAGTCEISGTDKNYKIYVDVPHPGAGAPCVVSSANHDFGGGAVKITPENFSELPLDEWQRKNWVPGDGVEHWVRVTPRGPNAHAKFYFGHFSPEDQQRFVDLYNEKKLPLEPRFGLYRLPFFMRLAKPEEQPNG